MCIVLCLFTKSYVHIIVPPPLLLHRRQRWQRVRLKLHTESHISNEEYDGFVIRCANCGAPSHTRHSPLVFVLTMAPMYFSCANRNMSADECSHHELCKFWIIQKENSFRIRILYVSFKHSLFPHFPFSALWHFYLLFFSLASWFFSFSMRCACNSKRARPETWTRSTHIFLRCAPAAMNRKPHPSE